MTQRFDCSVSDGTRFSTAIFLYSEKANDLYIAGCVQPGTLYIGGLQANGLSNLN